MNPTIGTIIALVILLWPAIQAILAKVAERKMKERREEEAAKRRTMPESVPRERTSPAARTSTVDRVRDELLARRQAQLQAVRQRQAARAKQVKEPLKQPAESRKAAKPSVFAQTVGRREKMKRGPQPTTIIGRSAKIERPLTEKRVAASEPRPRQPDLTAERKASRSPLATAPTAAPTPQRPFDWLHQSLAAGPRGLRHWVVLKELLDRPVSMRDPQL